MTRHLAKRKWVFEASVQCWHHEMMVREPEESLYMGDKFGKRLCAEGLASLLVDEFFAVADHIANNDPAVKSYLLGQPVLPKAVVDGQLA